MAYLANLGLADLAIKSETPVSAGLTAHRNGATRSADGVEVTAGTKKNSKIE